MVQFNRYVESETAWLGKYIQAGIFHQSFLKQLQAVHQLISQEPQKYLAGLHRFLAQVMPLTGSPSIYVARLISPAKREEKGSGVNIVISQSDPLYREISRELYPKTCQRLNLQINPLPFEALWADAYYLGGQAYLQGEIHQGSLDCRAEVLRDKSLIFRLGAPYMPELKRTQLLN